MISPAVPISSAGVIALLRAGVLVTIARPLARLNSIGLRFTAFPILVIRLFKLSAT